MYHIATHNIGFGYFMVIMGFVLVYVNNPKLYKAKANRSQ